MDDLLDDLHGSHYFNTLDLRSGYWQVSVADENREKWLLLPQTGSGNLFDFPLAVCGGPATFQRAIKIILSGLTYDICFYYFDDIIISSASLEQQCERLSAVLLRFRKHNLGVRLQSVPLDKYSATEKEALAAVFTTDHYFRSYLLGRKSTVVTDHHALRWLHSVNPKGRLARWFMDMQEYYFDVWQRPGNDNGSADALSRIPSISSCATGYNLLQAQQDDLDIQTAL